MTRPYRYFTWRKVWHSIPQAVFAQAYEDAAAWLEQEQNKPYDASTAILAVTEHLHERVARLAVFAFQERFGIWGSDDESILTLCFAACFARTDSLE